MAARSRWSRRPRHSAEPAFTLGCIPTKALLHFAEAYETTLHGEAIGIRTSGVELDFPLMQRRKQQIVDGHARGIEFLFKKHKIESIAGFGNSPAAGALKSTAPKASAS